MTEPTYKLDAATALRLFRTGELSPVELMTAVIERAEALNPRINAFTETFHAQALDQAREAERRYHRGGDLPPLLGLPVVTKEKHAIRACTHTKGLVAEKNQRADADQTLVTRIKAAGGIIHARTTMPEFSCATVTHSPLWGVTRNPWNPALSPGGSSGGSAAALAAGFTPLATGSDIAGSARIPAAFTGTVGYKAPYGRIPGAPPMAADHYRADAPLARTVADCKLLLNVLTGADKIDHDALPAKPISSNNATMAGRRIALCIRLGNYSVGPEVEAITRSVARALENAGARIEEITLPWNVDDIHATAFTHFGYILAPFMADATAEIDTSTLAPYTRQFISDAKQAAAQWRFVDGLEAETRMQSELASAMTGFDALLCPTSAVTSLDADGNYLNGIAVNGVDLQHYWQGHMTLPFNINSRCPVLTVPGGMLKEGLPCGVQVVGHPDDDATVFAVGAAIEKLVPLSSEPSFGDPNSPSSETKR